jgi:hypothetical protein
VSDVKRRLSRNKGFAKGSTLNGFGHRKMVSPRVSVSWPQDLLGRLCRESEAESVPFAEVVRRRVRASYFLKPLAGR